MKPGTPYPVTVHYNIAFVFGILAGISFNTKIQHVDMDCAESWIAGIKRNCDNEKLDYIASDFFISCVP